MAKLSMTALKVELGLGIRIDLYDPPYEFRTSLLNWVPWASPLEVEAQLRAKKATDPMNCRIFNRGEVLPIRDELRTRSLRNNVALT